VFVGKRETLTLIYILCPPAVYEAARRQGAYESDSLATEGFIHASPEHQLTRVANKYYRQHAELCVLAVDTARVASDVKWETISNGDVYPHIYGPLNLDAVVSVRTVARIEDYF
jgi:uncharacterized protein (DUF952 family)